MKKLIIELDTEADIFEMSIEGMPSVAEATEALCCGTGAFIYELHSREENGVSYEKLIDAFCAILQREKPSNWTDKQTAKD